jgi:hypothetical protein
VRRQGKIKVKLAETGWEGVDWIRVAQDRDKWQTLADTVRDLQASFNAVNFLTN